MLGKKIKRGLSLLAPVICYYALFIFHPDNLERYYVFGYPLTIALGILLMLWAAIFSLIYAYSK